MAANAHQHPLHQNPCRRSGLVAGLDVGRAIEASAGMETGLSPALYARLAHREMHAGSWPAPNLLHMVSVAKRRRHAGRRPACGDALSDFPRPLAKLPRVLQLQDCRLSLVGTWHREDYSRIWPRIKL